MIFDKIENSRIYFKDPIFDALFSDLKTFNHQTENGVYKTHDSYYFKVMSYDTKVDPTIIESHRREVDIQLLLSGSERIKLYDFESLQVIKPYDSESDCQFYTATDMPQSEVILVPGYMGVFFPDDIHQPQFINENIQTLKKIVIKVDEKLFS